MLLMIFSSSLLLFTACGNYPKGTLHVIDVNHNIAHQKEITNFNKEKCELELKTNPPIDLCGLDANGKPVMNPYFNGGVFITKEYYSKLQAKAKADCANDKKAVDQ